MRTLLNECNLKDYPGAIREIYLDGTIVNIEFTFWEDNDSCYEFCKDYASEGEAKESIDAFLANKQLSNCLQTGALNYDQVMRNIDDTKKNIINRILNDTIELPDSSVGFTYNGNKEYLKLMLETW